MKILAIDTSTLTGSVALLETGDAGLPLVAEITLSVRAIHSERLMSAVDRLMRDANVPLQEIDLFAVAHGPGSFTGLRIGIATVQGLVMATGKPAVGVSSLKGLAQNGVFHPGPVVPILDARRGEVYAAIYKKDEGKYPEVALSPDSFAEILAGFTNEGPLLLLGDGALAYREIFERRLGRSAEFAPAPFNTPRAANIGILGGREWQARGKRERLLPHYLRPAEVTFPSFHRS